MHSLTNERVISMADVSASAISFSRRKMISLKIYEIDKEYLAYISAYSEHVFYSPTDTQKRKYIGIILQVDGIRYFAPLSSFKPKHKKMREGVDFIKIKDYSVININNMIPVPEGCYRLVDVNGEKDPHYKYLLQAEAREINRHRNRILKNASIVRSHKLANDNSTPLAKRCNDFKRLEKAYLDFVK